VSPEEPSRVSGRPSTLKAVFGSTILSLGALILIHAAQSATGGSGTPDPQFYLLAEKYLDTTQRLFPTQSSVNGYHKYDGSLEDFSPESVAAMTATYQEFR
jgi:hypothetical protein